MKNVVLLGSTGSIGRSAAEVLERHPDRFKTFALVAHRQGRALCEQAARLKPRFCALTDESAWREVRGSFPAGVELLCGLDEVKEIIARPEVHVVLAGITGAAGLPTSLHAVECGKTLALANKESLVMAGEAMMRMAARRGVDILPVDSEHSAIFQSLKGGRREEVRRIILTASGGPFLHKSKDEIAAATPEQALKHPTWNMGAKITIDSATLFNKALEVIEARWLFGLPADRIDVVVHPQSIVHSMVEFVDASVIAQLGLPDMKVPIQYALSYPDRLEGLAPRLSFEEARTLTFQPPDLDRFPALRLGFEAARAGGTAGAVLNAANEVAVERFLRRDISFPRIPALVEEVLSRHRLVREPDLPAILDADRWAREEAARCSRS
ncbi:MAG: 1-deoxy-D-xylulose-5-phosphate reductoisomerase [Planctomycetes bacterium]|nr:1-deoxy-D-xylulose-5-phosphate reductoisomerase [Planctomycetota bacterium]